MLHVVIRGLRRDHEPVGDLTGGEAEGEQSEHLGLTGGQAGRERGSGHATVTRRGQDPLDRLPVEAAGGAHGPQFDRSILGRIRGPVRAIRRHSLVAVRGGDDPLGVVEVRAAEASMVAGPVDALMCPACRPGQRCGVRHPPQELVGHERVGLGPVPLVAREGSGLVPDRVGHRDPAQVVEQRGGLGGGTACRQGQGGDSPGVAGGPGRLEIGEVRKDEQRLVRAGVAQRRTRRGDRECRVPGVDRLEPIPPARRLCEDEIGEIGIVGPATPALDDLKRPRDSLHPGENLKLSGELDDPHRPGNHHALGPGRQSAAVPPLEGRGQRRTHGLVEAEANREDIGDFARGAEVELRGPATTRQHREHRPEPAHAGQARPRMADHQDA